MVWKIAKVGKEPAIDFAAKELRRCLMAMDADAQVAILGSVVYDPNMTDVLWLSVSPELGAQVKDPMLDDAYQIDVDCGAGKILGSNGRSVLMGAYRFLREMGCCWIRPGNDGEILPKCSTALVQVKLDEKASCRHRGICIEGAVSYEHVVDMIDWMPKVGLNAYFNQFYIPGAFYNRWYGHEGNPLLKGETLSSRQIEGIRNQTVEEMKQRGMLYHYAGHGWTCEPFGIPGESWDPMEHNIPKSVSRYFAKVNGKRALRGNVPLDTNMCYSQAAVRRKMADAVVRRCKDMPEVDYIHVWLADGGNNYCECEQCRKMRPSDWYVKLLNEIDEKMTMQKLNQKVVFILYMDLINEPERECLNNPDRFAFMFAPICRSYSTSFADAPYFDENDLPEYRLNKGGPPQSVSENLAWLRRWQKRITCDGFDFDYHYMWDYFCDPGHYEIAKILFKDMQSLHPVGMDGMISCQNQRVFFPNGLGMTAMAAALWDETADFDQVAEDYFRSAYGKDGALVQQYMQDISNAFDPVYIRKKKEWISPENAEKLASVPRILEKNKAMIARNAADQTLPEAVRASWEYLKYHAVYCEKLAAAFQKCAEGDAENLDDHLQDTLEYIRSHEMQLHHVLDVWGFQKSLMGWLHW